MTGSNPSAGGAQGRIEREEFARGRRAPGTPPVRPRPAATTVVARPGQTGHFEVLLLERPSTSRFAAGAFVFPGGVVDPADHSEFWDGRLPDLANLPASDRAACTAALRELFEETGLLLADEPLSDPGRLGAARDALLADTRSFDDVATELRATFRHAPVSYFARWITPREFSRRYDTLFFLVALADREHRITITSEHASALWATPAEALARCAADRLPMMFPTRQTLMHLRAFTDLADAMESLGGERVVPVEPTLDVRGDTVTPRLPDQDAGEPS